MSFKNILLVEDLFFQYTSKSPKYRTTLISPVLPKIVNLTHKQMKKRKSHNEKTKMAIVQRLLTSKLRKHNRSCTSYYRQIK